MIRTAALVSTLGLFIGGAAAADPIVVRSGDHDGFTRLVLRLPQDSSWQFREEPGLKTIEITGHDAGFDTSRVFNIIPRDQLVAVQNYPSRLELELACACEANTFIERGNFLVIDILDGPPLPPQVAERPDRFISARPASSFNFGDLLWSDFPGSESGAPQSNPEPRQMGEEAAAPSSTLSEEQKALVAATRDQLLRGVGNAASRGILEPATPNLNALLEDATPAPSLEIFDSSETEVNVVPPDYGNIRVTTSRDNPANAMPDSGLMTSGAVCAEPHRVAVPSWGGDLDLHSQVGALRRQLYSETDRLNTEVAVELARLYIHFGFGAEAKQALSLSESLTSAHPELVDLADIMEHGYARNPRFVHRFSDCDSPLALWAVMAAQTFPADQILNEQAALRALSSLPPHLKRFIAPILSKRLADYGSLDSASIALRNIEWDQSRGAASAQIAEAKIENKSGNTEEAESILSGVIEENTAETPQATIALIDTLISEGKTVPADVALLVETYAFENRKGPLAQELHRAHVIASAYSGQFAKAFQASQSAISRGNNDILADVQSHTFIALSKLADDITFLDGFFNHLPSPSSNLTPPAIEDVSSRLLDLGFPNDANELMSTVSVAERDDQHRLTQAEIYLALGQPQAALTTLALVRDEPFDDLRAEALLQLGENREAFEVFRSIDAETDAVRSAWLAEEWIELLPPETPVLGDIQSLAREVIAPLNATDGMLEAATSEVESSGNARETLETLLQSVAVPR